jgi:hypothetical protein
VAGEEVSRLGDEGLEIELAGHLGEDEVQHGGIVGGELEELVAAREDDAGVQVDGEDGFAGEEHVEEACDDAVLLDDVGIHGEGAAEGVEGLDVAQVAAQRRIGSLNEVGDQAELVHRGGQGREHEIPDAQQREVGKEACAPGGCEDEEENLANVMVALEVTEKRVAAEDFDDEVEELGLATLQLRLGIICGDMACAAAVSFLEGCRRPKPMDEGWEKQQETDDSGSR